MTMQGKMPGVLAPVNADAIGEFDDIIDARSPAEYALDAIPGAINCPVLDNDERRIVGTLYKQQGAFEARRVGGAMVAANLAKHLREQFADKPRDWRPLVYCWRGGLRSGTMVTWLRLVGWHAVQLRGGYKAFRADVMARIDEISPRLDLRVLCGPTGSAKTAILGALERAGAQVLDLEALAGHKGSVLGSVPGVEQPSQKHFETLLAARLRSFDLARPVFVEAESRKIGMLALPTSLLDRLRASPCLEIQAPVEARLTFLLRDYAYLGEDRECLAQTLGRLHGLVANEILAQWQAWARTGELAPLFEALMRQHYDPAYARSQRGHLTQLRQAEPVVVPSLSLAAIEALGPTLRAQVGDAPTSSG